MRNKGREYMKRKNKMLVLFVFMTIFLTSCIEKIERKSPQENILGSWQYKIKLESRDLGEFSDELRKQDITPSIVIEGDENFHREGKNDGSALITFIFVSKGIEVSAEFIMRSTADWSLHNNGKELLQTMTGSSITPLNEHAKGFSRKYPELIQVFTPLKGTSITTKIISLSSKKMITEVSGFNKRVTFNRE